MTNVLEDRTMCESRKACAEACPMRCATSPIDEVARIAHVLETKGRFGLTRGFIQHGTISVHAHVISVARASLAMAGRLERLGIRIDRASLIRGALLHDYFLYDWHDPDPSHRLHGFTHPFAARAQHHLPSHVPAGSHPSHLPRSMACVPGRQGLCAP